MVDERGYPVLDLSPLLQPGHDFAVRCYTRDEAKHFLSTMLHQHPHATRMWGWPNICWDDASDRSYTDYYPDINKYESQIMSWDATGWAEEHSNVVVIDFADLLNNSIACDLGSPREFNTDVEDLLGM